MTVLNKTGLNKTGLNAEIRAHFPVTDRMLYLDAAHQTPLAVPVRASLDAFLDEAQFTAGPKAGWLDRVEQVRAQLAGLLGVGAGEIAFTKNTSEGLNIAAHGLRWAPGDNVVLLASEHPNNAYAWLSQRAAGLEVRQVPDDKTWADAETFAAAVDGRTRAIALSHVMFHSGQRNDVESVVALARSVGAEVVLDAMQSVGVLPVDAGALGVAALAAGSHKGLLVPQGLGFLYTATDTDVLAPTYVGTAGVANTSDDLVAGPDAVVLRPDAHRFEIGNYNLPAIHALGGALDLLGSIGLPAIAEHLLDLGDRLIGHLDRLGIGLLGPRERDRRSHIHVLDLPDAGWPPYLAASGVRLSPVRDGLRVSFGIYNTAEDVDRLAVIVERGLRTVPARAS
ncbi:aminotransferase class V-fold PLP-dependent enzyme [Pseudonocardia sp. TRM90224]|uniref:aminotransferase class V-fold PLP-dependent enzyme n=1 Tax=Pseudonocardia sp. TRM90224 TaxID=2812678 RepID=UPI001E5FB7DB|nr:aminotransferase class V-fold PLP-dependent enzyme [Pseudonocardia sp. TRM90224]